MFREFAEVFTAVALIMAGVFSGILLLANVSGALADARSVTPPPACVSLPAEAAERVPLDLAVVSEASSCPPGAACLVYPLPSISVHEGGPHVP